MFCPLSNRPLTDSVIASNGKTYDKDTLMNLYDQKNDYILLPDGEKIENKFFEDKVTSEKVKKYLKENPHLISSVTEISRNNFLLAVKNNNLKEMELLINKEPLLLSEKLYDEKNVFQNLAQKNSSDNINKLCFLLKIARTKWSSVEWYSFFENHVVNNGNATVIAKVVQHGVFGVNDNGFSGQNTLLHLAAKYGHKTLVKKLIIKCEADTYLFNEENNKAKDVARPRSGIPQLIKESVQKKVFKHLFESKEKKFNTQIESVAKQNFALRKELDKAEKTTENLRNELNKVQKYAENLEVKLDGRLSRIERDLAQVSNRIDAMQIAHNNFVKSAREKGFFRSPRLQSTIQVRRQVAQCSYEKDDFEGKKDTYATLVSSTGNTTYMGAYCLYYETLFASDLSKEDEEKEYRKCFF